MQTIKGSSRRVTSKEHNIPSVTRRREENIDLF